MAINIFSTYSTGENRVTASLLAVLQSLSLNRIERLLGALLEQSEFELVRFQNQPGGGGPGVPDAIVLSSCRLLIETKIAFNTVDAKQLKRHLAKLDKATESTRILLVLTPDQNRPAAFDQLNDNRLAWASFAALDQSINELLDDPREVVSEREAFLLRELQAMLVREKLLASETDVLIVAARDAWPEYQKYHAYVCQPDRPFQPVTRMGFYTKGQIYPLLPKILDKPLEHVVFNPMEHRGELKALIERLIRETPRRSEQAFKVMFLSAPDAPDTVKLDQPIPNDLTTESGRTWAFTLSQRYASLGRLKSQNDE